MTSPSTWPGACKNMETEFPENAKRGELNFWPCGPNKNEIKKEKKPKDFCIRCNSKSTHSGFNRLRSNKGFRLMIELLRCQATSYHSFDFAGANYYHIFQIWIHHITRNKLSSLYKPHFFFISSYPKNKNKNCSTGAYYYN